MLVSSESLKSAVKAVSNTVGHGIVEKYANIQFDRSHLLSFDGIASTKHPLDTGISATVHAETLISIVAKLSAAEIDLSIESGKMLLKQGKFKATINLSKAPFVNLFTEERIALPESDFLNDAIKVCAAYGGGKKIEFNNVCFKGLFVYSCDGVRATRVITGVQSPKISIPINSLTSVMKVGKLKQLSVSPNLAFFSIDGGSEVAVMLSSACVNADSIAAAMQAQSFENCIFDITDEMSDAISRVQTLAEGRTRGIELRNSPHELTVMCESQVGVVEETVDWECKMPFRVGINSAQFLDASKHFTKIDMTNVIHGDCRSIKLIRGDGSCQVVALTILTNAV